VPRARPAMPVGLVLISPVPACLDANSVLGCDEFALIPACRGRGNFTGRGRVAKLPRDG
jgi:hypothetical protein